MTSEIGRPLFKTYEIMNKDETQLNKDEILTNKDETLKGKKTLISNERLSVEC